MLDETKFVSSNLKMQFFTLLSDDPHVIDLRQKENSLVCKLAEHPQQISWVLCKARSLVENLDCEVEEKITLTMVPTIIYRQKYKGIDIFPPPSLHFRLLPTTNILEIWDYLITIDDVEEHQQTFEGQHFLPLWFYQKESKKVIAAWQFEHTIDGYPYVSIVADQDQRLLQHYPNFRT